MDRSTLIMRCQQGDREGFAELYRQYSQKALGTAYLISGHRGIAEDILQEAFYQCFRKIKDLRSPEAFDIWFYRLLVRIGWTMAAKQQNHVSWDELQEQVPLAVPDDTELLLWEAINKLSTPLKTVTILYYYNDLSVKEIAKVLGCFQGTVKSRLHNARKVLQKELGEDCEQGGAVFPHRRKECKTNGAHMQL